MAAAKKANEAQFYFFCGTLDASTFEVVEFSGDDHVNRPYAFRITLSSENEDIAFADVINKQATLFIWRDGEYYPYSGVVTDFSFIGRHFDHATYTALLVPRLQLLDFNLQTRIFQNMKVTQIIKKVLDDANLSTYYDFKTSDGNYAQLEYVVQYQETDLNFISRLMETYGIWYFFNENPVLAEELDGSTGVETLVMADQASSFEFVTTTSDVLFRSAAGMIERVDREEKESISSIGETRRAVPKEVLLKDYNYRTPEVQLTGKKPVPDGTVGAVYEYGGHFKDTSGAQKAAEIEANRQATRLVTFAGESNCRGFRAGKRFTLQEHFKSGFNGAYVLLTVRHAGAHPQTGERATVSTYGNHFAGIPASQADRYRPERKTPVPRINGIMTGQIESNGSSYAAIDDQGRYKIRMPFDISNAKNMEGSRYVRLAQPYAGANYGMHFPSHEGTEMVWACVDGDPDRPLGLSTVPNANTLPPVTSGNKQQNVIRTAGGNEILLDDTDGKQKVRIITKGKHTVEMADEKKYITVQTTDKNALLLDDQNKKTAWNADKHNITMEYGSNKGITITTGGGHVIKIDDQNKKITIQSKAGNVIDMDDNGKKITLKDSNGKNTVQLDGSKGLVLDSQGKISISAMQDLELKAANIKMSTTSGKIDVKATQDLNLSGMKINEKATTDVNIEGMNVGVKAQLSAKIEGQVGVDIKSNLSTKVAGTVTEVSGQATTMVKGTIVMIN